ncbi:MAG TPA: hypothetical protein VIJ07_06515 [Dermatophilaceae bacterium]
MRHTDDEIERAARRFDQLADELDPETAEVDHTDDLGAIAAVSEAVCADEARLREAVEVAVHTTGHGTRSRSPWESPGKQPGSGSLTRRTPD